MLRSHRAGARPRRGRQKGCDPAVAGSITRVSNVPRNISAHVGRTPMVQLTRMGAADGTELFAKLEAFNPGGSVKDRIGVAMIEAAERDGLIEPGRTTIVEATSGNTGIALAFVRAVSGYRVVLTRL